MAFFFGENGSWCSDGNHGGAHIGTFSFISSRMIAYIHERTVGAEWCLLKRFRHLGLPHNLSIELTPALGVTAMAMAGLVMREERQASS